MQGTTSSSNMPTSPMERLGRENSALRVMVEKQKSELSQCRSRLAGCYGYAIELRVGLEAGTITPEQAIILVLHLLEHAGTPGDSTSAMLSKYQMMCEKNCEFVIPLAMPTSRDTESDGRPTRGDWYSRLKAWTGMS